MSTTLVILMNVIKSTFVPSSSTLFSDNDIQNHEYFLPFCSFPRERTNLKIFRVILGKNPE